MSGIRMSEKHGVNPSLLLCPICGEDSGVALVGRLPNDAEAPRRMLDQEPCKKCVDLMKQGCFLIEVDDPVQGEKPRRTGRMSVITDEGVRKAFDAQAAEQVIERRMAYITHSVWTSLGLDRFAEIGAE